MLFYRFDNRDEIKTLGNIIDGRLVNITPSSVYSSYSLIDDPIRASTRGMTNLYIIFVE